mgnify:CR=1 FL=1
MSIFHNNILSGASAQSYKIEKSLRFNSVDSAALTKTFGSGNTSTWTFSAWCKRAILGTYQQIFGAFTSGQSTENSLSFSGSNTFVVVIGTSGFLETLCTFTDTSAWVHIVVHYDATNGTASDRIKVYINGVRLTSLDFAYETYDNTASFINSARQHTLGRNDNAGTTPTSYFNGYLAEVYFVDGYALPASDFGQTNSVTGVWSPKQFTKPYGTNGFNLKFADASNTTSTTLGKDYGGNGNNWTPVNFSVTAGVNNDVYADVPSLYPDGGNGKGNYSVLSSFMNGGTIENGSLEFSTGATHGLAKNTIRVPSSGLWYVEASLLNASSLTVAAGLGLGTESLSTTANASTAANSWEVYASDKIYFNRNATQTNITGTANAGAILKLAVDMANNRAWVGIDNIWYDGSNGTTGDPGNLSNPTFTSLPANLFVIVNTYSNKLYVNFGQRPFEKTPPSNFKALNTQNLPDPLIKKPTTEFDLITWIGTGTGTQTISGLLFSPDLVWTKNRRNDVTGAGTNGAYQVRPGLVDTTRGANNVIFSSANNSENNTFSTLTAFASDGFTVGGTGDPFTTGNYGALNITNCEYLGHCWNKNASAGFDIVTYTGNATARTISHSLGVAPELIIIKQRSSTADWAVWHKDLGGGDYALTLNTTAARSNALDCWNGDPTSTVINLGTDSTVNANLATYVAYLWSGVEGFSKVGSYTGTGQNDNFVYCGFKPRVIYIKRRDTSGTASNWCLFSNKTYMGTGNIPRRSLRTTNKTNTVGAETSTTPAGINVQANGFSLMQLDGSPTSVYTQEANASGEIYIYLAIAAAPFKYALLGTIAE